MSEIVILSHGLGAITFLLIAVFLTFHKATLKNAPWVIIACLFTAHWSSIASLYGAGIIDDYQWVALAEVFQDGSWCLALLRMISVSPGLSASSRVRQHTMTVALIAGLSLMAINAFLIQRQWWPGMSSAFVQVDFVGHLLLSILGLSLIEQLYRGVKPHRRWGIKYLCLSLGALFSYDFFMYAHGLLFNRLDASLWAVRGAISLFVAPLILFSFFRNQRWHLDIAPSRMLIYRSTVIVSCGLYLLFMGTFGYLIRSLGGDWGRALQILFLFGAGLVLFSLLFSGKARAWVKVQMAKHVFRLYYDYRAEWLKFSELLGDQRSEHNLRTRIIIAFSGMVESPKGLLLEKHHYGFITKQQWNTQEVVDLELESLSGLLESIHEPCLVADLEESMLARAVRGFEHAWLILPLKVGQITEAVLILAQPRVHIELNWEVRDLLSTAAVQAAVFLRQEKLSSELSIAKQFESYHQISAFMLHDIKNLLSSIQLILQNRKHAQNPKYIESIFTTLETVHTKLSKLQNQLQYNKRSQCLEKVNLVSVIAGVIDNYRERDREIVFDKSAIISKIFVRVDSAQLKHCLIHLIDNAFEASAKDCEVKVSLKTESNYAILRVMDNGAGMSQLFIRNELFKPFNTTKGSKGMGIGVFQVKSFIEQYGGSLQVRSQEGHGTEFKILLPMVDTKASSTARTERIEEIS